MVVGQGKGMDVRELGLQKIIIESLADFYFTHINKHGLFVPIIPHF